MKKVKWGLVAVILVVGLTALVVGTGVGVVKGSPAGENEPGPIVIVATPVVELKSAAQVVIMGSGFEPGQELLVLLATMQGSNKIIYEISWGLSVNPLVANELGAWTTVFVPGRLVSKKVMSEGTYTVTVTDAEYNPLAYAPVAFYDAAKPVDEWPDWAKAIGGSEGE